MLFQKEKKRVIFLEMSSLYSW